jgi:ABC-type antimicrobial peptide transport system permease subunit
MKQPQSRLPKFGDWLLKLLARYDANPHLRGDFDEEFSFIYETKGFVWAWFWYWTHLLRSLPVFIKDIFFWRFIMFKNYLTIAFRNIRKHKSYSVTNILGLAIGMACCCLISLWVLDELHYDRFHEKSDRLCGAVNDQYFEGEKWTINNTPALLGPALEQEFPEVIAATRYQSYRQALLTHGEISSFENRIYLVDPSFLHMFSFPLISGDKNTALSDPNSIVISTDFAAKYFPNENPMGKILTLNNEHELLVTGILKKVPHNSSLTFQMLIPFKFYEGLRIQQGQSFHWRSNRPMTFIEMQDSKSAEALNFKIRNFVREKANDDTAPEFFIVLLEDFRFSPYYGGSGRATYISILSLIALFILLIACINFMNLSTARSANRAREIGLRKVVGANRKNIIFQFLGESLLFSFTALIAAITLVIICLPAFNQIFGKHLPVSILGSGFVPPVFIGITLLTGLVGGSYPALFLSSFKPVMTLKGNLKSRGKRGLMRKILVIFQFVLSVSLIISTVVIYWQLDYIKNSNLGYDKEHVIYIPLRAGSRESYRILKDKLLNDSRILSATGTTHRPSYIGSNSTGAKWDGQEKENEILIHMGRVDYDYIKTFKIEILEGSDFSAVHPSSRTTGFLVNEEMIKLMGIDKGVGARLEFWGVDGKIIGVMKNFHFLPLNYRIPPLAILYRSQELSYLVTRISPHNIPASVEFLKETWKTTVPDYPFEYHFLDSDFDRMYRDEERVGNILKSFAFLAIFIASLGLFGLASFTTEQRTKDIGIRKILGASIPGIVMQLSKEYTKCILIANVIAWPVAYFIMNKWLQNFAYRVDLSVWIFSLSGLSAMVIALLTISYQSIKAATANPVDSLRYE